MAEEEEKGGMIDFGQKAMQSRKQEDLILEAKSFFNSYKTELGKSIREGENVVGLSFPMLQEISPMLADGVLENPEDTFAILETAFGEL